MGVNAQHFVLMGVDIGDYQNENFLQLPYIQKYIYRYDPEDNYIDINWIDLEKDLKEKGLVILSDGYSSEYCIIGATLMVSENTRWESGCFRGIKSISPETIDEAKQKLLDSPFAPIIQPDEIKLYAGTHCT